MVIVDCSNRVDEQMKGDVRRQREPPSSTTGTSYNVLPPSFSRAPGSLLDLQRYYALSYIGNADVYIGVDAFVYYSIDSYLWYTSDAALSATVSQV